MSENLNQFESWDDPYFQEGVDGTLEVLDRLSSKEFGVINSKEEITELAFVRKTNGVYQEVQNRVILIKPLEFGRTLGFEVSIIAVRPMDRSPAVTALVNNYEIKAEGSFLLGEGDGDNTNTAYMRTGSVHAIHNALADYLEAKMQ